MRITYKELVTEDRELIVTAAEGEADQPAFDTPVKNYRIMEGMGVTFHCRMSGKPLPKVLLLHKTKCLKIQKHSEDLNLKETKIKLAVKMFSSRLLGSKMGNASERVTITRWKFCKMVEPASDLLRCCPKMRACTRPSQPMSWAMQSALGSFMWSHLESFQLRDTHHSRECRDSGTLCRRTFHLQLRPFSREHSI